MAAPASASWQSALVLLEAAMLALAVWCSGITQDRRYAIALLVVAIAVALLALLVDSDTLQGLVALVNVALVGATVIVIGLGVIDQREVNRQSIVGAICVYLLLGIVFTFFYGAVAWFGSGDFFAQGTDGTPALRTYFSYVTLATLGYGDYTAAGDLGRSLAIGEALLGQLYLVTVVALLVGHFGQRRSGGA